MSLTTVQVRAGLTTRIATYTTLREAKGPLGLELEPATVMDRSYEVVITDDADAGERVRAGTRMAITAQFVVRLVHRLPPKGGAEARDAALTDADTVRRVLLTAYSDALKECQNTITYGGCTREERGGGAYVLTTMRWALRYDCPLTT